MQVYSTSQGKFIDVPDQGGSPVAQTQQPVAQAPVQGVVSAQTTSNSQDPFAGTPFAGKSTRDISNLFLTMSLQDPKSAASLQNIYNTYVKPYQTAEQKAQDAAQKQAVIDKKVKAESLGSITNILDQYASLGGGDKAPVLGNILADIPLTQAHTYAQQSKGLYATLKGIAGAGQGSGVRINNLDINLWKDLFPQPGDTAAQVKSKIMSLNKQIQGTYGESLPSNYLSAYGIKPQATSSLTIPSDNSQAIQPQEGSQAGGYNYQVVNNQ